MPRQKITEEDTRYMRNLKKLVKKWPTELLQRAEHWRMLGSSIHTVILAELAVRRTLETTPEPISALDLPHDEVQRMIHAMSTGQVGIRVIPATAEQRAMGWASAIEVYSLVKSEEGVSVTQDQVTETLQKQDFV